MEILYGGLPAWAFWLACAITVFAGFVKGAIGFAMPLIMIATFSSFMPPDLALAALILSVLFSNLQQTFRNGLAPAIDAGRRYLPFLISMTLGILVSAPFIVVLPERLMLGLLGAMLIIFAVVQLTGWHPDVPPRARVPAQIGLGLTGGLYGGVSGVWGPPLIVYLLAIRATKAETVPVLGVAFLIGAVVLTGAHLTTGVLNAQTIPFSLALVPPGILGMWLGFKLQDRLDPVRFRFWTLVVLIAVSINLLRRGLFG